MSWFQATGLYSDRVHDVPEAAPSTGADGDAQIYAAEGGLDDLHDLAEWAAGQLIGLD